MATSLKFAPWLLIAVAVFFEVFALSEPASCGPAGSSWLQKVWLPGAPLLVIAASALWAAFPASRRAKLAIPAVVLSGGLWLSNVSEVLRCLGG